MSDYEGIDPHLKAYVCIHIFQDTRVILLVSRADGDWSFVCGEEHENSASAYRVVGIGHVLTRDPTLKALLDLPPNWEAERRSPSDPWIRTSGVPGDA